MQRDQLLAGRYRLLERLGSGGMSEVYRAYDEVLERDVAVKVLVASDAGARQRIQGEARAAARLSHPHVTSVYDYGESSVDGVQVPFVVMELLGGHTLEQRLAVGPLPPRAGLRVCAEVASALADAHAQGLVHRDIKPSNVMLTPKGAKVLDFGIAAAAGDSEIDFEGRLLGTPAYLAPERLEAGEVLPACDVYALGLLLHRVLTGRLPWPAEAQSGMLRAHTHVEPAPLPPIDGVPSEVHRLYRWCLARDPADRPPAVEAARILLAAAAAASPAAGVGGTAAGPAAEVSGTASPAAGVGGTAAGPASEAAEPAAGTGGTAAEPAAGTGGTAAGKAGTAAGPGVDADGSGAGARAGGTEDDPVPRADPTARGSAEPAPRRGTWRRRRAMVAVSGAVLVAVAMAGSLGDSDNRRHGPKGPTTGSGPGTTTVGMPSIEEPPVVGDTGPAAVPSFRTAAPATRSVPPAGPSPSVSSPAPNPTGSPTAVGPTPTPGEGTSADARGGTVTFRCVGKSVEVLAVTTAPGFRVEAYDPGPAKQIQVDLTSVEHRSEIRVNCPNGRPNPKVKERPV
ncbi:serine/threonine-protein kinase [Micromonospora chokoriensis]|uniref:non-specific serine/threonine protein kinase n=1 Tax=Micromonospora chokoriensis TaxID=356851 RepID=A0A1C4VNU2_9ACTN|nr:serine/threonine-protein kinase [Micromonospora chokoriensis]SCE85646.1 serine/threonine protein kinase [Micromonospora chokoriensis]